jgi:hypothetical protein
MMLYKNINNISITLYILSLSLVYAAAEGNMRKNMKKTEKEKNTRVSSQSEKFFPFEILLLLLYHQ